MSARLELQPRAGRERRKRVPNQFEEEEGEGGRSLPPVSAATKLMPVLQCTKLTPGAASSFINGRRRRDRRLFFVSRLFSTTSSPPQLSKASTAHTEASASLPWAYESSADDKLSPLRGTRILRILSFHASFPQAQSLCQSAKTPSPPRTPPPRLGGIAVGPELGTRPAKPGILFRPLSLCPFAPTATTCVCASATSSATMTATASSNEQTPLLAAG